MVCCCEKSTFRPRERLSDAERSEAAKFFWPFCSFGAAFLPQARAQCRHNAGGRLRRAALQAERAEKKSALQAKQIKVSKGEWLKWPDHLCAVLLAFDESIEIFLPNPRWLFVDQIADNSYVHIEVVCLEVKRLYYVELAV